MKLWSDYEGRTIDEVYPLQKLVRSEGRSAFFLTTNGTGTPALVRVIEAHFDESEILDRWKAVSEIGQENLITMRKFGETVLDGTPLVYAVMEPTEISLEELLQNRTLTTEETNELATSLVDALKALHARAMVHGQVEPANILAAGESVKLRSDCVRPAVDDPENEGPTAEQMKAKDAHALAVVLLQALTGKATLQGSSTLLPSPFDSIIRNGLSGRWGLAEMDTALAPFRPRLASAAPKPAASMAKNGGNDTASKDVAVSVVKDVTIPSAAPKIESATASHPAENKTLPAQESLFVDAKPGAGTPNGPRPGPKPLPGRPIPMRAPAEAPDVRHRIVKHLEEEPKPNRVWLAVVAAVVVVLLFLGWRWMRSGPATNANRTAKPASSLSSPATAGTTSAPAPDKPSATRYSGGKAPAAGSRPAAPVASTDTPAPAAGADGSKTQWRVVAYTYNHEDQAQQKAGAIQKQHPSLNAEVFSPTGRAPYLVTVGGPMSHNQAAVFSQKARHEGLPRDLYMQNYSH